MSSKVLLLTFGCSWTYGVGACYTPGMTREQFRHAAWDENICDQLSWRGILSEKYHLFNRNYARGGSSNQKQQRLAMQYFGSEQFQEDRTAFEKIIVLWGITSTARTELFDLKRNRLQNIFLVETDKLAKSLLTLSYNHDFEVWFLAQKMRFWNVFFQSLNIKNIWFDTFNHHDYSVVQPGLEDIEHVYKDVAGPDWPSWKEFVNGSADSDSGIYQEIMDKKRWPFWKYRAQPTHDLNLWLSDQNPRDLMSLLCFDNGYKVIDSNYHLSNWHSDSKRVDYLVKQDILNPMTLHPTREGHRQISQFLADPLESLLE